MHVGKLPIQLALKQQMYRRRGSGLLWPARADDMVHGRTSKTLGTRSLILCLFSGFSWMRHIRITVKATVY